MARNCEIKYYAHRFRYHKGYEIVSFYKTIQYQDSHNLGISWYSHKKGWSEPMFSPSNIHRVDRRDEIIEGNFDRFYKKWLYAKSEIEQELITGEKSEIFYVVSDSPNYSYSCDRSRRVLIRYTFADDKEFLYHKHKFHINADCKPRWMRICDESFIKEWMLPEFDYEVYKRSFMETTKVQYTFNSKYRNIKRYYNNCYGTWAFKYRNKTKTWSFDIDTRKDRNTSLVSKVVAERRLALEGIL